MCVLKNGQESFHLVPTRSSRELSIFTFVRLCCAVISAEPCIITGHLGAVGRAEPAASDDQAYCVCGPALVCPRSQTHGHGRTFSSDKPAPRRTCHGHDQGRALQKWRRTP